jgi:hypothetical protein
MDSDRLNLFVNDTGLIGNVKYERLIRVICEIRGQSLSFAFRGNFLFKRIDLRAF